MILTIVWILLLLERVQSLSNSASASVPARLLVLDTLVPGQRLRLDITDPPPSFLDLCRNEPFPIVVVGREGLSLHSRGVEVFLEGDSSSNSRCSSLTLAATGRIADISDDGIDEGSRWKGREGRVRWLTNLQEDDYALSPGKEPKEVTTEKIMALCETIGDLASEWEDTLKVSGRERFPGHLRGIMEDLGSIPDEPNRRALWVAGLINPLPALGVALEVRPAVLTARTTSRRLILAKQGLRDSVDRMRRPGPCF